MFMVEICVHMYCGVPWKRGRPKDLPIFGTQFLNSGQEPDGITAKEGINPLWLGCNLFNIQEPRINMKTYGDRSFSACAPKLWNQLPNNIRAAGSVALFKRQLKTHLLMYISTNYIWISTAILWQWNLMRLWACLYGKGQYQMTILLLILLGYRNNFYANLLPPKCLKFIHSTL